MSNYPDGMDWGAYDDSQDPALECGCRSSDDCDCWCEHGSGTPHLVGRCDSDNCALLQCNDCGAEVENDEDSYIICKECIVERGCQCKDPDRKVWIDCSVGIEYKLPARYSVKCQFARAHWTLSPTNFDLEGRKKTTVNSVKCSSCMLEVDLYV
jgi:hypothetical protein